MLPAGRAVARTQSTARSRPPPAVFQASRARPRTPARDTRGRVSFFTRLKLPTRASQPRRARTFAVVGGAGRVSSWPRSSRTQKVHEPLLRGGIGRGAGGVRSRRRGPAASRCARTASARGQGRRLQGRPPILSGSADRSRPAHSLMPTGARVAPRRRASLFGARLGRTGGHGSRPTFSRVSGSRRGISCEG